MTMKTEKLQRPQSSEVCPEAVKKMLESVSGKERSKMLLAFKRRARPRPKVCDITDEDVSSVCSMCGGHVELLGVLGNTRHGRCRNCGIEQTL